MVSEWKAIESAPRDGRAFKTYSAHADAAIKERSVIQPGATPFMVMAWPITDVEPMPVDECGDWHDVHCYHPTHWAELDEAPEPSHD